MGCATVGMVHLPFVALSAVLLGGLKRHLRTFLYVKKIPGHDEKAKTDASSKKKKIE